MSALVCGFAIFPAILCAQSSMVHVAGETTATGNQIKDVLRSIQAYEESRLHCAEIEAVKSHILPPTFRRSNSPGPEGMHRANYERWEISLCSMKVDFLITFWEPSDAHGVMFAVTEFPANE